MVYSKEKTDTISALQFKRGLYADDILFLLSTLKLSKGVDQPMGTRPYLT